MVRLHFAFTAPINPTGATPVLTESQIWSGLQRKIRFAQEFVPIIESCDVLSDENGVVERVVKFKEGAGPKPSAKEVVKSYWPSWVDFVQEDGLVVKNVVSDSGEGETKDLHMTYVFEFDIPGVEANSPAAAEKLKMFKGNAKIAVESSIDTIRQMVIDGRIKE